MAFSAARCLNASMSCCSELWFFISCFLLWSVRFWGGRRVATFLTYSLYLCNFSQKMTIYISISSQTTIYMRYHLLFQFWFDFDDTDILLKIKFFRRDKRRQRNRLPSHFPFIQQESDISLRAKNHFRDILALSHTFSLDKT